MGTDITISSPTVTISTSGSDRIRVREPRSRVSSGESASVYSPATSSGSRGFSSISSDDDYVTVHYEDDLISPSDSASLPRQPPLRRRNTEAPQPPSRRHSSRRSAREEEPRRRQSSSRQASTRPARRAESIRTHSDESASVASGDDYPYYSHHVPAPHAPQPPRSGYSQHPGVRHVPAPSHGGYAPSMTSQAPYQDPYSAQALVQMGGHAHFPYQQPNPFDANGQGREHPFSPLSSQGSAAGNSYFVGEPMAPPMPQHRPQGPTRPQSFAAQSQYPGSELMSQYGPPANVPAMYPGYGMPMPPPWALYAPRPPSSRGSPAPEKKEEKKDTTSAEIESLKALIQKQEEARIAADNARIAKAEADAAEAARKRAEEEAEKRKKQEIADASKKAKEEAEKTAAEAAQKAKEEHEKKLAEAQKAKEDLEKKHKELEAEAAKLKPTPDSLKAPIRFKDALGRKFSFPWHICKTWKGMEGLIKQAFLHVDVLGEHVHAGHYDLTGPDGEIILPQVWDTMIQPDVEVTMHIWPMPEPELSPHDRLAADAEMYAAGGEPALDFGSLSMGGPSHKKGKSSKSSSKKKTKSPEMFGVGHVPPAPPPARKGGAVMTDPMAEFMPPPGEGKKSSHSKSKSKSSKVVSPFQAWLVATALQHPFVSFANLARYDHLHQSTIVSNIAAKSICHATRKSRISVIYLNDCRFAESPPRKQNFRGASLPPGSLSSEISYDLI
nr:hypothetical protein CFP56_75502 [Quercus suber]